MHILLILAVVLVGYIIQNITSRNKQKKTVIWCGMILFLYAALRAFSVGTDVVGYVSIYQAVQYMSFKEIFISNTTISRDPIFYCFLKLLTYLNKDPQFILIVIAAIVAICISIFIYKNSVNVILSFVMFIGLRYFSFTLTGLRQAIAWSLVMLSYDYLKEKKLLKFILIIFLASLFHKSALIFIIAYSLVIMNKIKIVSLSAPLILFINYITNEGLVKVILKIPMFEQYENYSFGESTNSGSTMLFLYFCILVFGLIMIKQIIKINNKGYLMYNLAVVGTIITFLSFNYANIFRIGLYFILPIITLFPLTIESIQDRKLQIILNFVVVILLIIQFIIIGPGAGTGNYKFFWQ